ncbi:MAG: hypothetical protein ACFHU9_04565 [Fluviicola sp.]
MSTEQVSEQGKTRAIVAHITLIGWIIAVVQNGENKDEYASFYIRQMLGIVLVGIASAVLSLIPIIGLLISLGVVALWVLSLVWAASGEKKELPVIGPLFQDWFKSL